MKQIDALRVKLKGGDRLVELVRKDKNIAIGTSENLFKPHIKKPVLYIRRGNCSTRIASFVDVESMNDFWKILEELGVTKE